MHQLQVDLADMSVFSTAPYRYMLVAIDVFTKKGAAVPLASKTAPAVANAWQQVVQSLGIPSYVYSDDGSEFKAEFKQRLDYYDVDKVVSRGHAYFVERLIRTLKGGPGAQALRGPRGSEPLAPAAARRPGAVQCANSRGHGHDAQPGLQRSLQRRSTLGR